jgi:hypothetical protein
MNKVYKAPLTPNSERSQSAYFRLQLTVGAAVCVGQDAVLLQRREEGVDARE